MNPVIRVVRILQFAFVVSVLLFYFVLHLTNPAPRNVAPAVQLAIVCFAIGSARAGFVVQRVLLNASNRPDSTTQNSTPRSRWFAGNVIRFVTAESVALFGFALRMMGSYSNVVIALFVASLLLLLFWQPGKVPTAAESQTPIR